MNAASSTNGTFKDESLLNFALTWPFLLVGMWWEDIGYWRAGRYQGEPYSAKDFIKEFLIVGGGMAALLAEVVAGLCLSVLYLKFIMWVAQLSFALPSLYTVFMSLLCAVGAYVVA